MEFARINGTSQRLCYFVTGASGFVGRHLCAALVESGCEVRALIRRPDRYLSSLGVSTWVGDLWDESTLAEAVNDVDIVVHCAGNPRYGNGPTYYRANVDLTNRVINATKRNAKTLKRFVFVSTIGAIDRSNHDSCTSPLTEEAAPFPSSDYGVSKLEAETAVRKSGLPFAIVRPTMVVGDGMRVDSHFAVFARQILSGSLAMRIAWPGIFSVVHVDDLAQGILVIATHKEAEGKTFFCAGESISIATFARICDSRRKRFPLTWMIPVARLLRKFLPLSLKALILPALTASDGRLRALGWRPRHTAATALGDVVAREKARLDPEASPGGQTVITGAASGLGYALTQYLAPRRNRLLLIDKDEVSLRALAMSFNNCKALVVDLADEGAVDSLLESTEWNRSRITELYACAGIGKKGKMQEIHNADHRRMFKVNVLARIALAQSAIASMQRWQFGRIVLISSSSAFQPLPYMASYAATNSSLLSLGEAWSVEVARDGVHVMTVCPGGMRTNFQKSGGVKELKGERLMSPIAVTKNIMSGLMRQKQTLHISVRSFAMSILARVLPRKISVDLWFRLMEKMR